MMFSRMAPTVLFTAFCVAAAGAYVTEGSKPLTRPGTPDAAYIQSLNAFTDEIALALQVGDHDRFRDLLEAQVSSASEIGASPDFQPDTLPAPYQKLRSIVMRGTPSELHAYLAAHPNLELNKAMGRYGSVPLFWATANNRGAQPMMQSLIEAGADPHFASQTGYTLAHVICSPFAFDLQNDVSGAMGLLPEDLLTARTKANATPFHLALANGQGAIALALLERGAADPNERTPSTLPPELQPGEMPLMLAGADVALVDALLFAGADPLALDARGVPILETIKQAANEAEQFVQDRMKASEAEEFDRRFAADYRKVQSRVQAAADGRLATDG